MDRLNIKDRIKEIKPDNVSFTAIEKQAGIPENSINRWDKTMPSADKLDLVASELGTTSHYLLTGEQETPIQMDGRTQEAVDLFLALTDDQKSALMDFLKSLASSK